LCPHPFPWFLIPWCHASFIFVIPIADTYLPPFFPPPHTRVVIPVPLSTLSNPCTRFFFAPPFSPTSSRPRRGVPLHTNNMVPGSTFVPFLGTAALFVTSGEPQTHDYPLRPYSITAPIFFNEFISERYIVGLESHRVSATLLPPYAIRGSLLRFSRAGIFSYGFLTPLPSVPLWSVLSQLFPPPLPIRDRGGATV